MKVTIPVPLTNKANTYEVHFHPTFWREIKDLVAGLKQYIKGPLYWIGPCKEAKETERVVGYYSHHVLPDDTLHEVKMTIWVRGKLDLDAVKAVLDGVQLGGRLKNDKQVAELHI